MTNAYMLVHDNYSNEGSKNTKLIGVYRTQIQLENGLSLVREKPGFSSAPNGFCVREFELNTIVIDKGELVL